MVWLPYQVYQLRVLALCDLARSLRGVRQGAGILITSRGGSLLMYDVTSRDYLGVPGGGQAPRTSRQFGWNQSQLTGPRRFEDGQPTGPVGRLR